jgi:hypothetical protein
MMVYGEAIEAMRIGKCITRKSWNGGMVCKQISAAISSEIIPKMQSLSDTTKSILLNRGIAPLYYEDQMIIIKPNGEINSWIANGSDTFATDWKVVEP